MFSRRLVALALASSVAACGALAGCAAPTADDEDDAALAGGSGDGTSEDAIVSERQLMGIDCPTRRSASRSTTAPARAPRSSPSSSPPKACTAPSSSTARTSPVVRAPLDTIVGRGHLLANHTQNHLQLTKLSGDKVVKEVADTDAFIVRAQPNQPFVLRAPFGAWNGATARAVNATPMKKYVGSVFWDVGGELTAHSAADWDCWGKGVSVQRCGELYLQEIRAKKHGIVLMHDVHNKSVDMMKQILPTLKAEGYKFAALTDVPSVKRAIGAVSEVTAGDQGCSSSTLGRTVPENACVQSRSDQKWHRCEDNEWVASSGAADPKCTGRQVPALTWMLRAAEAEDDPEPAAREVEQVDRDVDPEEDVEPAGEREEPDVARVVVQEAQERRDELRDAAHDRRRPCFSTRLVVRLDGRRASRTARAGGRSS